MGTMKCMLCKASLIVFLILTIQPPLPCSSDEIPPPKVLSAAEQGIGIFVKDSRAKNLHLFGIAGKEQADAASLGQGFQVFSIPPDLLLGRVSSRSLDDLAVASNLWQFLIVTDKKAASLLTVDFFNGKWTPVSIGASGLAMEMAALLEQWPSSAGYRHKLIRVYQSKSDLMEIFQGEKIIGVVPFTSARIAMGLVDQVFDPLDLHGSQEILTKLSPVVKTNIR